jgi:hypothetical protein
MIRRCTSSRLLVALRSRRTSRAETLPKSYDSGMTARRDATPASVIVAAIVAVVFLSQA